MSKYLFFLFLLFSTSVSSQTLTLDFETDSLNGWEPLNSGHWKADSQNPILGNYSLHHSYDDESSNFSTIAYRHEQLYFDSSNASWEFKVRHEYAPSSGNNWSFCLAANLGATEQHPNGNINAYYVGVNFTGSDDLLKIWKQIGTNVSPLLSTNYNWQNDHPLGSEMHLRIERGTSGNWSLFIKQVDSVKWDALGEAIDNQLLVSDYIGVYYEYSSSQDRKLWLDDIAVQGHFYSDIAPPAIEKHKALDRRTVGIWFNEAIDTSKKISFRLNSESKPGNINWINSARVELEFKSKFLEYNELEITGLSDLKGNVAKAQTINFNFYHAQPYDILINEILADPVDSVGLPEQEFIELYNQCTKPINISGWLLYVNNKAIEFAEDINLLPGGYYIISKNRGAWDTYSDSQLIEVGDLPALPNAGALLQLKDKYLNTIHVVDYSERWYATDFKGKGGWTLELADKKQACLQQENWMESISVTGGTPGKENSISNAPIVPELPDILSCYASLPNELTFHFSKTMDSLALVDIANYSVNNSLSIVSVQVSPPMFQKATLLLNAPMSEGLVYSLSMSDGIRDCVGNSPKTKEFKFGVPHKLEAGNVVINEVLFDASEYVPEFIELYNRSGQVIELQHCYLGVFGNEDTEPGKQGVLSTANFQLVPGGHYVFTENKKLLLNAFTSILERNVVELSNWPSLPNSGGSIGLYNHKGAEMDRVPYADDMHFQLLSNTKAVSLERLSPDKNGVLEKNWHSASSVRGYATPTEINSQFIGNEELEEKVTIKPKQISPNNDGYQDIIQVVCKFSKPGYLVHVRIYNRAGTLVETLANNDVAGTDGAYTWDGLGSAGQRLPMGYYIIVVEALHPEGDKAFSKEAILMLPKNK